MTRARAAAPPPASSDLAEIGPAIAISLSEISGLDPVNTRIASAAEIDALAASLKAKGQISALVVRRHDNKFRVVAGGRRWLAFGKIADEMGAGALYRIKVSVRVFAGSDEAARAISLAENFEREAMHWLDEAESFERLARDFSFGAIVTTFGITAKYLRERLALAALSPLAKLHIRERGLSLEAAKALTLARSHGDMDALLNDPDAAFLFKAPFDLRKHLTQGATRASAPLARFVGEAAYLAAGGTIVDTLFGDEPLFAESGLLRRLEAEKLQAEAARLRREEGWGYSQGAGDPLSDFAPRAPDYLPDETAALSAIARASHKGETTAALLAERDRIERSAILRAIPQSERHKYGVWVGVDSEGRLAVERGLYLKKQSFAEGASVPPTDSALDGDSPPRETGRGRGGAAPDAAPSHDEADEEGSSAMSGRARDGHSPGSPVAPRPLYRPAPDAPIPLAARRIAETAASRAIAEIISEAAIEPALALMLASSASAGRHRRPIRIEREQGPFGATSPTAMSLSKLTFDEAHAAVRKLSFDELLALFSEIVAASLDLRGLDGDYVKAMARVAAELDPAARAKIATIFDYRAYFDACPRSACLIAIREIGGEALERQHAWKKEADIAAETALLARGAGWLPAYLRSES